MNKIKDDLQAVVIGFVFAIPYIVHLLKDVK
jgi:hypothetical protein